MSEVVPRVLRRCCGPILFLVAVTLATGACHDGGGSGGDNDKWKRVGGDGTRDSWDAVAGGFEEVRVLQVYQRKIYAGLVNPTLRQGQVWEYDGVSWRQVAGDGIMGSWTTGSVMSVDSLAADGGYLYAGTGLHLGMAQVWRFDGSQWQKIGGDGLNGGWGNDMDSVWNLSLHLGQLYAGLVGEDSGEQRALLYRFDGAQWELVTGENGERGGWAKNTGYTMAYVSVSDGQYLYTGLAGRGDGAADVWRFDGSTFQQIGGDGLNGGWSNPDTRFVEDAIVWNGELYVSLQGTHTGETLDPPVWKWDGSRWLAVGDVPAEWASDSIFNKLLVFQGTLYVTAGGPPGSASVWRLDDGTWKKIGGYGLDGSAWHTGPGASGTQWIYTLTEYLGNLYAGLASAETSGAAQVWEYVP